MAPRDEHFFFAGGRHRLFGTWQGTERLRAVALYCHPLGEEKKSAHRTVVEALRALADEGVASLRFDMTGCGDSDGEFPEATFALWMEDIASAWQEMARRAGDVPRVLTGLRLGASLAAMAAPRLDGVRALALWQPIIHGKAEFDAELRRLLIQQMMTHGKAERQGDFLAAFQRGERELELDGYALSTELYADIGRIDLPALRTQLPAATAVVQFARPSPRVESFIRGEPAFTSALLDLPPIWARTDFVPSAETGRLLAKEGIARWLA